MTSLKQLKNEIIVLNASNDEEIKGELSDKLGYDDFVGQNVTVLVRHTASGSVTEEERSYSGEQMGNSISRGVLITKSETYTGNMIAKVLSNPIGVGASLFRVGVKEDTYSDTAVYAV